MADSSFADLVSVTCATTGTGTLTLGAAVTGFRGVSALSNEAQYSYAIEDGLNRETGYGTYTAAGPSLTRSLDASTTGALLNLSGQARVSITALARDLNAKAARLSPTLTAASAAAPAVIARGAAGQSANRQEWQKSSGGLAAAIGPAGTLGVAGAAAVGSTLINVTGSVERADSLSLGLGLDLKAINSLSGDVSGARFSAETWFAGSVGWCDAIRGAIISNNASCSVSNARSISAESPSVIAGSVGTAYGLHVSPQKVSGVTTGYAIYSMGASDLSYLAGKLGVGRTPQASAFIAVGGSTTGSASLNIASGAAPTSPQNGDIWFDGADLKLRAGGSTYTLQKT